LWTSHRFTVGPGDPVAGSPASDSRLLFLPSAGTPGGIQAVGRDDGHPVWSHEAQWPIVSSPAVGRDVVMFGEGAPGNSAGALVAISASDGHELWRFEAGAAVVASPAIVG